MPDVILAILHCALFFTLTFQNLCAMVLLFSLSPQQFKQDDSKMKTFDGQTRRRKSKGTRTTGGHGNKSVRRTTQDIFYFTLLYYFRFFRFFLFPLLPLDGATTSAMTSATDDAKGRTLQEDGHCRWKRTDNARDDAGERMSRPMMQDNQPFILFCFILLFSLSLIYF